MIPGPGWRALEVHTFFEFRIADQVRELMWDVADTAKSNVRRHIDVERHVIFRHPFPKVQPLPISGYANFECERGRRGVGQLNARC